MFAPDITVNLQSLLFCHVPGFRVVMPQSPTQAKGLLPPSILESKNPIIFNGTQNSLPCCSGAGSGSIIYPLPQQSRNREFRHRFDHRIIWKANVQYTCSTAIEAAEKGFKGINIELIDLRTIFPWDRQTILESVKKTGRTIVVHESMVNLGVGARVAATIQDAAFLHLKAPVKWIGR
jgi:2-oxoisovalerate dehydrogenase E1 component beta subunit